MPVPVRARLHRTADTARTFALLGATAALIACGAATDALTDPGGSTSGGGIDTSHVVVTSVFDSTHSFVRIVSDPGEYVGSGKTYLYTPANAIIIVKGDTGHLGVRIVGMQAWAGSMFFAGLASLKAGAYANLGTYDRYNTASGIEWFGPGGACSRYTGSVTIDSVRYVADSVSALDMTFEQRCEYMAPLLRGKIRWRGDDVFTTGPVLPIPTTLWYPVLPSELQGKSYLYLESDPGDPIGNGQSYLYTTPSTSILVNSTGGNFSVTTPSFNGGFATMSTLASVKVGYYPNVMLRGEHNPVFGGMTWSATGAEKCSSVIGWFVVDKVAYNDYAMSSIDLRFEQHCNGLTASLRGAVHWNLF